MIGAGFYKKGEKGRCWGRRVGAKIRIISFSRDITCLVSTH
jgi:hypothetical protein